MIQFYFINPLKFVIIYFIGGILNTIFFSETFILLISYRL